jgi:hypothetical protein
MVIMHRGDAMYRHTEPHHSGVIPANAGTSRYNTELAGQAP